MEKTKNVLEYFSQVKQRFTEIELLYKRKKLTLAVDELSHTGKTECEELYAIEVGFDSTKPLFVVYGFDFYVKELSEQEFKQHLGPTSRNLRIYHAYDKLSKHRARVKITDILAELHNEEKDSQIVHGLLQRILTLAYYFNWKLEKDVKDFEGDSYITIPSQYFLMLQQKFDFDPLTILFEDDSAFMFVNRRGQIQVVLKHMNMFTKKELSQEVFSIIQKVFLIDTIELQ